MVGIWFRIEKGPEVGPGVHGYDESGVVYEGIAARLVSSLSSQSANIKPRHSDVEG